MPGRTTVPPPEAAVELRAGDVVVTVYPGAGGRIGQITVAGQPLLVDVPPPGAPPMSWGSFPMAPWAGRIRNGRFTHGGRPHQLQINHHDGEGGPERSHSLHGTVFDRPWTVDDHGLTAVVLSCPLTGALEWPFTGTARQRIELSPDALVTRLTVESDSDRFPAEVGWHPWFRKPATLEFAPTAMYRRDDVGIPTGELIEPTPGPWDDCFVNTDPVMLHYDRDEVAAVTVTSDCDHWVVFDHMDHATCVEPQSGPPDAFNLGAHVVDPETSLTRTMTITW